MIVRPPAWLAPHRAVLLALGILVGYAVVLSMVDGGDEGFGYPPTAVLKSLVTVVVVSGAVTYLGAVLVRVPPNSDSWLITALILFFVMPLAADAAMWKTAAIGAAAASASKYLVLWRRRLIVNPVVAGAVTCYAFSAAQVGGLAYLSWWVACREMVLPVLIVGIVLVTILREWWLLAVYAAAALMTAAIAATVHPTGHTLGFIVVSTPLLFLGVFMLPEPMTSPATRTPRLAYAALVGALMYSSIHWRVTDTYIFGFDPEIALLVGCLFAFGVRVAGGTTRRVRLDVSTEPVAASTFRISGHSADGPVDFRAGQWATVSRPAWSWPVWRRSRRVFSFASAPHRGTVEFAFTARAPSAFKQVLIDGADHVYLDNIGGDFVIGPATWRRSERIVFLASGIGITPVVAILRAAIDAHRDLSTVTVIHVVRSADCGTYEEVLAAGVARGAGVDVVVSPELAAGLDSEALVALAALPGDGSPTQYFLAGSPEFVSTTARAVRQVDRAARWRWWRIHTDSFTGY